VLERRVIVAIEEGLHARPAALFARLAADQPFAITIRKDDGEPAQAASILSVMTLGVRCGDEVFLATEDPAAGPSLDALVEFLATAS